MATQRDSIATIRIAPENTSISALCSTGSPREPSASMRPRSITTRRSSQQRERQVVQHADHRDAGAHLSPHQPHQRHLVQRVEVGRGLIQQQQGARRPRGHARAARAGVRRPTARAGGAAATACIRIQQRPVDSGFVLRGRRGEQAELRQAAQDARPRAPSARHSFRPAARATPPASHARAPAIARAARRSVEPHPCRAAASRRARAAASTLPAPFGPNDRGPAWLHGQAHVPARLAYCRARRSRHEPAASS